MANLRYSNTSAAAGNSSLTSNEREKGNLHFAVLSARGNDILVPAKRKHRVKQDRP